MYTYDYQEHSHIEPLHPFCVAWSYKKDGSDYIVLIIETKHGFTKQLCSHRNIELNNTIEMVALIEGPYGRELDLDSYGTVLLFATGIGIAAQLSYIWQLLNRSHTSQSRTKKIQLYWQVEREVHTAWVADRMIELKNRDTSQILDIHIYVLGGFLSLETKEGSHVPRGKLRIGVTYEAMNVDNIVKEESGQRQGRLAILTCVDKETGVSIRQSVSGLRGDIVSLKELEFRPDKFNSLDTERNIP
ncbi:hypothetical protein S40288_10350 [Stachybotrys chartarum IBT 40288]|nr:hypothetical protein S40288_10350 [Stachybotrys chartarum IBT 40288]